MIPTTLTTDANTPAVPQDHHAPMPPHKKRASPADPSKRKPGLLERAPAAKPTKPAPQRASWIRRWQDVLLVTLGTGAFLLATRNYARHDLLSESRRLDLALQFNYLDRVLDGHAAYSEVPIIYGPYWLAYFVGVLELFGRSVGGIHMGIALLAWVQAVALYALASRLGSPLVGLFAAVSTLASSSLTLRIPYSSEVIAPLLIGLAGAVWWAAQDRTRPHRWALAGMFAGWLMSVKWTAGLAALASVGAAWVAGAQAHPPGRRGHLVGTLALPIAAIASTAVVLRPFPLALQVAFGIPLLASAMLAACEGYRRRAEGPGSWRAWVRVPAWCAAGLVGALLPWLVVLGSQRGFVRAVYEVNLRINRYFPVGDFSSDRWHAFMNTIFWAHWPTGAVLLGLAAVAGVLAGHAVASRDRARTLSLVLLPLGGVALLLESLSGPGPAWGLMVSTRFWILFQAYAAWALYTAWRGTGKPDAPPGLVPLACMAGVSTLHSLPGDFLHVPAGQGPLLVLGAILAARWVAQDTRGPVRWRLAAVPAMLVVSFVVATEVSYFWVTWKSASWFDVERRDLVWAEMPRVQVWDDAASYDTWKRHIAYVNEVLPPGAPLFMFPTALLPVLTGHTWHAPVWYFIPGYTTAAADADTAEWLRTHPPAMVGYQVRFQDWYGDPQRLKDSFPLIFAAIGELYKPVRQLDDVVYFLPRDRSPRDAPQSR